MTKYEMETITNMNEAEDTASIYTNKPSLMRRWKAWGFKVIREDKQHGKTIGIAFEAPKECVVVRKPKPKRNYTEEQRKALAARFKKNS